MRFCVGTLTRLGGPGLALCDLQGDRLALLHADNSFVDPSYLIFAAGQNRLYATGRDIQAEENSGIVSVVSVTDQRFNLLSRQSTGGEGPCHLALSPNGRFLCVANYHSGSLAVLPVTENGLGSIVQLVCHEGQGTHPVRQQSPHIHQVVFMPGTHLLCVVDLGLDCLFTYAQDQETGRLTLAAKTILPSGLGPRHMIFGSNGYAWVAHELGNAVSVLRQKGAAFVPVQTVSTLPADWRGENTAAAIRLAPDGRALYVSNRGHDSIAVFDVLADGGRIVCRGILPAGGAPRDFIILDDGRLLAANQTGNVALFSGAPSHKPLGALPLTAAVCVCPLSPAAGA